MVVVSDNKQISKMIDVLKELGISKQDCALAERYLSGNVGDEVLDQFQRKKFGYSNVSYDVHQEIKKLMKGLDQRNKRAACIRLFNVLFAIGHATCIYVFSYCIGEVYEIEECALYKRITLYIAYGDYNLIPGQRKNLLERVHNSLDVLRELVEPIKKEGERYALTILSLYFGVKYQKNDCVAVEDTALMEEYEELLLHCLDTWMAQKGCGVHAQLTASVRVGQLPKELSGIVGEDGQKRGELQFFEFIVSIAYLNFRLSEILANIVRACIMIDIHDTLFSLEQAYIEAGNIKVVGADYDELFGIDPKTYICWAAMVESEAILKRQLHKHEECYLQALDEGEYRQLNIAYQNRSGHLDDIMEAVNFLKDVLRQENPQLYQQVMGSALKDHERMIGQLVADTPHAELAKEYLRGNCKVSELYPYDDEFGDGFPNGSSVQIFLWRYYKHCIDEDFINRCNVFLTMRHFPYVRDVEDRDGENGIKPFFASLEKEQLDLAHQMSGFCASYKANEHYKGYTSHELTKRAEEIFSGYLETRREEMLRAFAQAGAEGRYLGLRVMCKDAVRNKQEILRYTADGSKLVREELLDILRTQTDWAEEIKTLLQSKKAAQRELAILTLAHWQQEGGDYSEILLQAMEQEKNAKILALMQNALNLQEQNMPKATLSKEDLVKQLHKGNRKKSLQWAYGTPFSPVHRANGDVAGEEYLQAILLCYVSQDKCGISKNAQFLVEDLNPVEFACYVNVLFDCWLAAGAESKKRWVLYAASIHGGEDIIKKLYRQVQEWPLMMRGAVAAEAVKALALNPSPRALLLVEDISRKFKFKQVKAAAGEALEFAATELNITREELSDRIVPDLGFDENMERMFDYGERTFKVMLTPELDVEVYDETGKKLKNLPAPGKKDDTEKAAEAYASFKEMKKQMKAAVTSQKSRLEYALSAKREWSVDAWRKLFVGNPPMHQFAIGLIWGIYKDGQLLQSFRYMEDGSFNTQDGDEYVLPEQARIGLVHAVELSDEEKRAWREQLDDYEITQPIDQLDRPVYYLAEEEADKKSLERFGGCIMNGLTFNSRLTGLGWYRGSVQDAGYFYTYYREDAESGMGVELHFSGSFIGGDNDEVTVYDVRFYKAGAVAHGRYGYDEADEEKAYFLKDVPPRYFSEIVLQLAKVTASSKEKDEGWKKDAGLIS